MAEFHSAAAGAGVIPWTQDLSPAAEDWFYLLAALPLPLQRSLSLKGACILAGQLRALAAWSTSASHNLEHGSGSTRPVYRLMYAVAALGAPLRFVRSFALRLGRRESYATTRDPTWHEQARKMRRTLGYVWYTLVACR